MVTAQIQLVNNSLGIHWVCRLWEPGGYTWDGQVAHTSFALINKDEFTKRCCELFGNIKF